MNRIQLISGPRNLSTALMYSFANRGDTSIVDEPMYASYLSRKNIFHPGRKDILSTQNQDINFVINEVLMGEYPKPNLFIKNMAHHFIGLNWKFILDFKNIIYLRNPKQLIASFAKVIEQPTLQDIGLQQAFELWEFLNEHNQKPIILDSGELLKNPEKVLQTVCEKLSIPFTGKMLSWDAGPRKEDGIWAKYWYANVHKSTGFVKQKTSDRVLPKYLNPLYEEALQYYQPLFEKSIKA